MTHQDSRPVALRIRKWGGGTPRFLLLHGFGDGGYIWDPIIPALVRQGAAIAVDLRGHGESDHDPDRHYDIRKHVADVVAVLEAYCHEPIQLIGHSLGAEIALHVAALHGQLVSGAVLVDGGPELNAQAMRHMREQFLSQSWHYDTIGEFTERLRQMLPLAQPALLAAMAPQALCEEEAGGYRLRCDRALAQERESSGNAERWFLFRHIRCRVLVVRGAASAILTRVAVARMTRELPRCSLRTVPLAGHALMLENPSGLIAVLTRYLLESNMADVSDGARP